WKTLEDLDVLIPYKVILGPILPESIEPTLLTGDVQAGTRVGTLTGNEFQIQILDQYGVFLDPLSVFTIFKKKTLWEFSTVNNPFLPAEQADFTICLPNPSRRDIAPAAPG